MGKYIHYLPSFHFTFHFFHFIIKYPGMAVGNTGRYFSFQINFDSLRAARYSEKA